MRLQLTCEPGQAGRAQVSGSPFHHLAQPPWPLNLCLIHSHHPHHPHHSHQGEGGGTEPVNPLYRGGIEAKSGKSTCRIPRWGAWVSGPVFVQLFSILIHSELSPWREQGSAWVLEAQVQSQTSHRIGQVTSTSLYLVHLQMSTLRGLRLSIIKHYRYYNAL